MKLDIYQVDAFTGKVFAGNPAAVCPVTQEWPANAVLQSIAAENNLSETAFFRSENGEYALRWFTPRAEVDLCGHATLASAFVIFRHVDAAAETVRFSTRSGTLEVTRRDDLLRMDFPTRPAQGLTGDADVVAALGSEPTELLLSRDYLAVYESQGEIAALEPDMRLLERLGRCVIVSAPGDNVDCVSRFFAPHLGIPEDPVTGSAHCTLVPYWAQRLGKGTLHCRQLSERGGELFCEDLGTRIAIAGRAVQYLRGEIEV